MIQINTYKYASKFGTGFHDTLLEVYPKENGEVYICYGEIEYPSGYKDGKQNDCVITVKSGLAIELDYKARISEIHGKVEEILQDASIITGQTFYIKDWLKENFNVKWNGEVKGWEKK